MMIQSQPDLLFRDVYDCMGTADSLLMTGEKCFKWNQITMVATWKLLRSVERRVEGHGPQLTNAEAQIQVCSLTFASIETLS